jgi:hypothetical protein
MIASLNPKENLRGLHAVVAEAIFSPKTPVRCFCLPYWRRDESLSFLRWSFTNEARAGCSSE